MTKWVAQFVFILLGIELKVTYESDPSKKEATVIMPTHASALDVFATFGSSLKPICYIMKRSLSFVPFVGITGNKAGSIPIDRKNLKSAIESLNQAAEQISREKITTSISPEGTRRRKKSIGNSDQLLPFKKGPFHLAKNSNSSIIPVVWVGCRRISKGLLPCQGKIFYLFSKELFMEST